jgi:hypothetical protein
MSITATKIADRDCYGITYDGSTGDGVVTASFTNQADGDKSQYVGLDDGQFIVTVDAGWQGTDDVTITNEADEVVDEGTVSFA